MFLKFVGSALLNVWVCRKIEGSDCCTSVFCFESSFQTVEVNMEEQTVKAVHLKAQEPVENCTKEQFVEETVPQCQAETQKLSHCRAREAVNFRTVQQIVEMSALWSQEGTVDVSTVRTQGRISERNFECHKCWSLPSW